MAVRTHNARRLQFSLRALFLLTLLAGIYFGSWEATKKFAENERNTQLVDTYALAPFVIYRYEDSEERIQYYLWLFGATVELPYSTPLAPRENAGTFP
jgi:hypothetical protein